MSLPTLAELPAILLPIAQRAEQSFRDAVATLDDDRLASMPFHGHALWLARARYELLTGRPPFQGESLTDTLQQVLHTATASLERSLQAVLPPEAAAVPGDRSSSGPQTPVSRALNAYRS